MSDPLVEDFKRFLRSKSMHVMEKKDIVQFGTLGGNAYPLDYPIFPYYFEEGNDRSKILQLLIVNFGAVYRHGVGFSPEDTSLGNILILPPKHRHLSTYDFLASGGLKMTFKFGRAVAKRMKNYEQYCGMLLDRYCDEDTWYWENFTVAEGHQGEGIGSKLMKVLFEYLDSIDASCYLETHSRSNAQLYEHYGFKIMETGYIPGTNIEHYAMLRKKKSQW